MLSASYCTWVGESLFRPPPASFSSVPATFTASDGCGVSGVGGGGDGNCKIVSSGCGADGGCKVFFVGGGAGGDCNVDDGGTGVGGCFAVGVGGGCEVSVVVGGAGCGGVVVFLVSSIELVVFIDSEASLVAVVDNVGCGVVAGGDAVDGVVAMLSPSPCPWVGDGLFRPPPVSLSSVAVLFTASNGCGVSVVGGGAGGDCEVTVVVGGAGGSCGTLVVVVVVGSSSGIVVVDSENAVPTVVDDVGGVVAGGNAGDGVVAMLAPSASPWVGGDLFGPPPVPFSAVPATFAADGPSEDIFV
jgi:hypothetical protein